MAQQLQTLVLDVGGMKCGGCSAAVKSILLKQPGVKGAAVNLLTESAAVTVRWVQSCTFSYNGLGSTARWVQGSTVRWVQGSTLRWVQGSTVK